MVRYSVIDPFLGVLFDFVYVLHLSPFLGCPHLFSVIDPFLGVFFDLDFLFDLDLDVLPFPALGRNQIRDKRQKNDRFPSPNGLRYGLNSANTGMVLRPIQAIGKADLPTD